jgi:hypothetical protein
LAAQAEVLKYNMFVNLPEFLRLTAKLPKEETASRSVMGGIMSAPAGSNKTSKIEPQPQKGTKARILNVAAIQSLMVDAENFKALE